MTWLSILYYYCNIFTPTVVARLKIRKRLILKKLLPLPAPFQHFRFRVRFRFQPLSSKCFRFHKKLTASTSLVQTDLWNTYADIFLVIDSFQDALIFPGHHILLILTHLTTFSGATSRKGSTITIQRL